MTLIIGVLCQDGVVVGADSSVTFSAGSTPTIEQPDHHKIQIITGDVILAVTGQVGMGQRFKYVIEQHRNCLKDRHAINGVTLLSQAAARNFSSTGAPKGSLGAILAFYANSDFHLCEFGVNDFQPELKTQETCFVSMGCGQPIGDPFLALLRRTLWENTSPTVNEAIFAVTWVLDHAIKVNPGGINAPCRLALLIKPDKGTPEARILPDSEVQEHLSNVKGAEEHLRQYGKGAPAPTTNEHLEPPAPPAQRAPA